MFDKSDLPTTVAEHTTSITLAIPYHYNIFKGIYTISESTQESEELIMDSVY